MSKIWFQPIEEHVENRAFTKERIYKNTFYLVKNTAANKRYYVLSEVATPTKTLYEVCEVQKHVDGKHKSCVVFVVNLLRYYN